jgi:protein SCO1/2
MQIRNLAQRMALTSGGAADAQVLIVSIDPLDTPELADRAKQKYLDALLPAARTERWHFLSGAAAEIAQLTKAMGFSYGYDEATHQFAHPAGFALINADGKIARYFFGFDYTAADLDNAFDAAAALRIASPIARLLLVCFHYDITTGRYTGRILEVLRVVSTITLLGALALGWSMLRRARRHRNSEA